MGINRSKHVQIAQDISPSLKKYNNRKKLCFELDRIPRVQGFEWNIDRLAKYFHDLKPYVIKEKFGFDEIDQAAISSKSPALMLTWEDYMKYHEIIQIHRSLFSYIFLAECTNEKVKNSTQLIKLQSK
jgi:hypothetical protein